MVMKLGWQRENWHVTTWLTAVCFASFILGHQSPGWFHTYFSFQPALAIHRGFLWQFLTYPFSFTSPTGFFFTVLLLLLFGNGLEAIWGSREFLVFLAVTIVGPSLIAALYGVPLAGIQPVYFNLLVVYAFHFPDTVITLWLIVFIPVKVRWIAVVAAITTFIWCISLGAPGYIMLLGSSSGIIYWGMRLRSGRLARRVRAKVRKAKKAIVKEQDPATGAAAILEEIRAAKNANDDKQLGAIKERIAPAVNVCPEDHFVADAPYCQPCNGFIECALRANGISDLPARKAGGRTATGAAHAITAMAAREREAARQKRKARAKKR